MFVWYGRFKNRPGIVTKVFKDDKGTAKVEVEPVPKGRKKPKTRNILPYRAMNEEDSAKHKKIYDEETKKLRERKKQAQLQVLKIAARFSVTANRGVAVEINDFLRSIRDGIEDLQSSSESRATQKGESVTYTLEQAEKDIRMWQGEAQKAFEALGRNVTSAVGSLPNWAGSNVTVRAMVDKSSSPISWFGDDGPKLNITGEVFVHEGSSWRSQPSFTAFANEEGDLHAIDDVLDAGDSDFFHDPKVEADYFSLTEELRNPGRARSQGNKVLTLYTARPKKDRHLYDGAKHIPNNVFLSTSEDEAYGYSRDLGGDRDVYLIRIKRMYLVETLQTGSLRNYQSFNGQGSNVPVQSSELIHEGEAFNVTAR
jgi:hypothetical protein